MSSLTLSRIDLWKTTSPSPARLGESQQRKTSDPEPHADCANSRRLGVMPTTSAKDGIDMPSVPQSSDVPPPSTHRQARPSICPTCGLTADNAITVHSELTATSTYVDTAGHIWAVTWMAVSA